MTRRLTSQQKQRLQYATYRTIEISFCTFVVCLIIAVVAQMNVWQVLVVIGSFLTGGACSFVFTALIALDVADDEEVEAV